MAEPPAGSNFSLRGDFNISGPDEPNQPVLLLQQIMALKVDM